MLKSCLRSANKTLHVSLSMIWNSFGSLALFELIYKLAAAFIVLPFSAWLLSEAASYSSIKFIGGENYLSWVFSPIILLALFIVLLVLAVYTLYEIAFLTLVFDQFKSDERRDFFHMLSAAGKDALRSVRLRNLRIIPYVIIMTPFANSAVISALIEGFTIPSYIVDRVLGKPTLFAAVTAAGTVLFIILVIFSPAFVSYCLFDRDAKDSFRISAKLMKGHRLSFVLTFIIDMLFLAAVIFGVRELAYIILSASVRVFKNYEPLYAALLAANSTVKQIIDFLLPSSLVVCAYAVIQTLYFKVSTGAEAQPQHFSRISFRSSTSGKIKLSVIVAAVLVVCVIGSSYMDAVSGISNFNSGDTLITAHRGASLDYPENTLPAFVQAVELQADFIELDVQLSADGEVVVFHDANLKRVTGKNALVSSLTLEELKELDCGYYMSEFRGQGITIPTLAEVFETIGSDINYNIEIKSSTGIELVEKTAQLISEYELADNCVITSTKRESLKYMKTLFPDIPCGYIMTVALGNFYDEDYADFYAVDESYCTKKLVSKAHKYGKGVTVWTVDSAEEIEKFIALGVDNIITDDPLLAREVLTAADDPLSILDYLLLV